MIPVANFGGENPNSLIVGTSHSLKKLGGRKPIKWGGKNQERGWAGWSGWKQLKQKEIKLRRQETGLRSKKQHGRGRKRGARKGRE